MIYAGHVAHRGQFVLWSQGHMGHVGHILCHFDNFGHKVTLVTLCFFSRNAFHGVTRTRHTRRSYLPLFLPYHEPYLPPPRNFGLNSEKFCAIMWVERGVLVLIGLFCKIQSFLLDWLYLAGAKFSLATISIHLPGNVWSGAPP